MGYNYQTGNWVLGAEADGDWTNQRSNLRVQNFLASSVVVAPAAYALTQEQKITWLATARARLGWSSGYSLWYVTGGAAWGGVKSSSTFGAILGSVGSTLAVPVTPAGTPAFHVFTSSSDITDHIVRAGLNYRIGG